MGWVFLSLLFSLPDTRGLQLSSIYTRTYFAKYPIVENNGKHPVVISRFYDEYNHTIYAESRFLWGSCYLLPEGYFIQLTMDEEKFYSHEIYVEFYDGYKCKLGSV